MLKLLTVCCLSVVFVFGWGAENECKDRCFDDYNSTLPCQCTIDCHDYGNCCSDFDQYCSSGNNSCELRCGVYNGTMQCQCDPTCRNYGNCCPDFMTYCSGLLNGTCEDRCGEPYDPAQVCQCASSCLDYDDCCPDYMALCPVNSCAGRCGLPYDEASPCQCNAECVLFDYCCPDAASICANDVTDAELQSLSQQLWDADVDRLAVTIDLQAVTPDGSSTDNAPLPLCSAIPNEINTLPIYTTLQALFDNFQTDESIVETSSPTTDAEVEAFLDALFASQPLTLTFNFLASKGLVPNDITQFRSMLKSIWFSNYNRQGVLSSSGAEDVLVGETPTLGDAVDGLYNWVRFCTLEQAGSVNYLGYAKTTDYGEAVLVRHPYYWGSHFKAVGELLIGTSPAFDLSIYTLCYYARVNALCNLVVNSLSLPIQTYVMTYNSQGYVATSYPAY